MHKWCMLSKLSWRPKQTPRATRETRFENLTFLSYNLYFLHKYKYILSLWYYDLALFSLHLDS